RRRQFEIVSVGFVGAMPAAAALDLVVEKTIEFLKARSASSAFARRPKRMASPQITQLHDLVPGHPRLKVTVEKESPSTVRSNIDFPELVGAKSALRQDKVMPS